MPAKPSGGISDYQLGDPSAGAIAPGGIAGEPEIPSWSSIKEAAKGVVKSAVQVPNTIAGWLDTIAAKEDPMMDRVNAALDNHAPPTAPTHMRQTLENFENKVAPGVANPIHGQAQETGGFVEQMGEFLYGEGEARAAFEALPMSKKLQAVAKASAFLEEHPVIAKGAAIALKQGAMGAGAGAQQLAHGATPAEAGETGLLAAGTGALLEGAGATAKSAAERLAKPSVTADEIRAGTKDVVANRLNETNATRTATPAENAPTAPYKFRIQGTPTVDTTQGSIAQEPQKRHIGTRVVEGKGPSERLVYPPNEAPETQTNYMDVNQGDPNAPGYHKSPIYRLTEDSKPGQITKADSAAGGGVLLTEDPKVASAHLASLDEIMRSPEFAQMSSEQQQAYRASREDIRSQIAEQYQHTKAMGTNTPNFKPVDVQAALDASGDPLKAKAQLDAAGREVYDHANNVSGGQWQTLKDNIQEWEKELSGTSDIPANATPRRALIRKIGQAQDRMDAILDDPRNGIDRDDALQAKKNFHAGFMLDRMNDVVDPIFQLEQHNGYATGKYRGFDGRQLGLKWQEFLDDPRNANARELLGPDRVQTLTRLMRENETMAGRRRFGEGVLNLAAAVTGSATGAHLGGAVGAGEGALAGPAAYQAIRYTLNQLISTPKVAKSLLFAIDSGARPENYAPGLARMIADKSLAAGRRLGRAAIPVAAGAVAKDADGGDQ